MLQHRGNQLKRPFSFLENGKFQTVQKSITWKSSLPSRKWPDFTSCMPSAQMCHAILACMVNTAKIKHPHLTLPFTSATKCYLRVMKHTILHQATKMPSCLEDSNKFSNNSVVPLYPKRHDFKMFPFLILIHLDMCWWFQPNWKKWRVKAIPLWNYHLCCVMSLLAHQVSPSFRIPEIITKFHAAHLECSVKKRHGHHLVAKACDWYLLRHQYSALVSNVSNPGVMEKLYPTFPWCLAGMFSSSGSSGIS